MIVGLTGGIGTGKSTVAMMLANKGAAVVDADAIARQVVERGSDVLAQIVESFGKDILQPSGELNRSEMARVVFADDDKRRILEAIVQPAVGVRIAETIAQLKDTTDLIVLDIPLLFEAGWGDSDLCDATIVVVSSIETALARLKAKGFSEQDARARMAAQISIEEKAKLATHVIDNDSTIDALRARVDHVHATLMLAISGRTDIA